MNDTGAYKFICHIGLEDHGGNVVYQNGYHQIPIVVWYKAIGAAAATTALRPGELPGDVEITLVDASTGSALDMTSGWRCSEEKNDTTASEWRAGERGSRPDDESGYIKKIIYLQHEMNVCPEEACRLRAAVSVHSPRYGYVTGISDETVTVHRVPVQKWSAHDLHVISVDFMTADDKAENWEIASDYSNMYRWANITVRFGDARKSVTKVVYGNGSNKDADAVFSTRRQSLYQVDAYMWSFGGASGGLRNRTAYCWFNGGPTVPIPLQYNDNNGFVISLICYLNVNGYSYDDGVNAWSQTPNTVTVYDEQDTPGIIFLNQIIPTNWKDIKNYPDNKYYNNVVSDSAMTLVPKNYSYFRMNALPAPGNSRTNPWPGANVGLKDSYMVASYGYSKFTVIWAGGTNRITLAGADMMFNDGDQVQIGYDGLRSAYAAGTSRPLITWYLYPQWSSGGFTARTTIDNSTLWYTITITDYGGVLSVMPVDFEPFPGDYAVFYGLTPWEPDDQ